jgi:hypothetical protein
MKDRIRNTLKEAFYISENIQLATKIYFDTNKLDEDERDLVLDVVSRNKNYAKFIADTLYYRKETNQLFKLENEKYILENYLDEIIRYNKNIFPIKGFSDINNINGTAGFLQSLITRKKL